MLSDELRVFCERWLKKADRYGESTEDIFDKFFSLYVVYNAIYFDITIELINTKRIGKKRTGDRISATKNIPIYIEEGILSQKLYAMANDINVIINLIKNGIFYISTEKDNITPAPHIDQEQVKFIEIYLLTKKRSDMKKFNESVLSLIYGVRCNMFHGKKGFDPIQKELLIPMNNILEMIIKDLLLADKGRV